MTTTLSNGVKVPDIGSHNWGSDLETNWLLLNACIGAVGSNVQTYRANTWTASQTFTLPIYGDVVGTATMASSDASGNDIPTTYATKTELAAKAADSEVVHKAGAETITGDKTHSGILGITGNNLFAWERPQVTMGTLPSSTVYYGTTRYRDSEQATFCLQRGSVATTGTTTMNWYAYAWNDASIYRGFTLSISADGTAAQLKPLNNATTDLGTSANKWKSLNGVNPGALGMPDFSKYVDISSSITDLSGELININNNLLSSAPGWISIAIPYVAGDYIKYELGKAGTAAGYNASRFFMCGSSSNTYIALFAPYVPDLWGSLRIKASGGALMHARFYPCLGNV